MKSQQTAETPSQSDKLRRLRRRHVIEMYAISARLLSSWQRRRVIPYEKIGRTVLFRPEDIEQALARFRHEAVGEKAR